MKISKITLIILGVVITAGACAYFYMTYLRHLDEQDAVRAQMAQDQQTLARLSSEREAVQSQILKMQEQVAQRQQVLSAAQTELAAARASWPTARTESIEYDEAFFKLADDWNLAVTIIQTGEPSALSSKGISFATTTFDISLTGMPLTTGFTDAFDYQDYLYAVVGNMLGFIGNLAEHEAFATARIDIVNMAVPPLLTDDELVEMGAESLPPQPTANVSVTVFTLK